MSFLGSDVDVRHNQRVDHTHVWVHMQMSPHMGMDIWAWIQISPYMDIYLRVWEVKAFVTTLLTLSAEVIVNTIFYVIRKSNDPQVINYRGRNIIWTFRR